jgi:lysozyme
MTIANKKKKLMRMNCLWAKLLLGSLLFIMFDPFDYLPEFLGGNPEKPAQNKKVEGKPSYTPLIKQKAQAKTAEPLPAVVKGSLVNYNTKQESNPLNIVKPLLDENEGFEENAYYDKLGKIWTIGNGLTYYPDGTKVKKGDTITRELNNKYVDSVLQERVAKLSKYPNWSKLNPNQQATLLDFSFNTGANWNKTDNKNLIEALSNPNKINDLPKVMASYRMAGGKVVQGLVNRRERANKLFNTPYQQEQKK